MEALYLSDIWIHIQAHSNQLEREWELFDQRSRWDFELARNLCHTVYLAAGPKHPERNAEKYWPSPWNQKKKEKEVPIIAKTHQEIWDAHMKMKEERKKNGG